MGTVAMHTTSAATGWSSTRDPSSVARTRTTEKPVDQLHGQVLGRPDGPARVLEFVVEPGRLEKREVRHRRGFVHQLALQGIAQALSLAGNHKLEDPKRHLDHHTEQYVDTGNHERSHRPVVRECLYEELGEPHGSRLDQAKECIHQEHDDDMARRCTHDQPETARQAPIDAESLPNLCQESGRPNRAQRRLIALATHRVSCLPRQQLHPGRRASPLRPDVR